MLMKRLGLLAIVLAGVLAAAPAQAALIRLTPQGMSVADYDSSGLPLDPANIDSDGFRLTYHGGGDEDLVNPVMLIMAVPTSSLIAPILSASGVGCCSVSINVGDTQTRYGGTWNTTTGYAGNFNSTTNSKVYDFIGFTPTGSSSENYTNWTGATGISSWNLFVYSLTFNPLISRGDYVEFNTNLPTGSYVIGYGCEALDSSGRCTGKGTTESTPFTFAGLVTTTQVPEPSTLMLLFAPVSGLLFARRRRA
jgi:hypothetical protein